MTEKTCRKSCMQSTAALLLFVASPTMSWAFPLCEINTSVSEFQLRNEPTSSQTSVADVFPERDTSEPFIIFSMAAEEAVLSATERTFCEGSLEDVTVDVELVFVELGMHMSESELQKLRSVAVGTQGAYAEVSVDSENKQVVARIIWNPRRMLRDQLLLDGWEFDEEAPLFPFLDTEFRMFLREYSDQVVKTGTPTEADENSVRLRRGMPEDLYSLFSLSGRSTRVPFWSSVGYATRNLVESSLAGHTLATVSAIDQVFDGKKSSAINDIYDLDLSVVRVFGTNGSLN